MSPDSPTSSPEPRLDPDFELGAKVGEYEIDVKLGQGGFGTVWKGTHPLIGKVVAIKVLARRFSVDPEMVSRFVAEARAVNQIRHRHIVDIFSFGYLDDGRAYYVMEYLDGETLDVRLEREAMSLAEAIPILRGIARALDAAHAKGIAHRDLKAENVLVARDDDGVPFPKLLDFGIAKLLAPEDGTSHKTRTGAPIGTPYYMSPEQCRGRGVDHRTDYYAFGVLAYLMLTRAFPLDGDDYMSILMAQMTRETAPASSLVSLPDGVDAVLAWLMQKDAAKRPPSLAAAMAALEEASEPGLAAKAPQTPRQTARSFGSESRPSDPGLAAKAPQTPRQTPRSFGSEGLPVPDPDHAVLTDVVTGRHRGRWFAAVVGAGAVAVIVIVVVAASWQGAESPAETHRPDIASAFTDPGSRESAPQAASTRALASGSGAESTVVVTVEGSPDRFDAVIAGRVVGTVPGPLSLDRSDGPVDVGFRKPGFAPQKRTIVPNISQKLTIHLEHRPLPPHAQQPAPDPHSTENPFP